MERQPEPEWSYKRGYAIDRDSWISRRSIRVHEARDVTAA